MSSPAVSPSIFSVLWPDSAQSTNEAQDEATTSYRAVPNRSDPRHFLPRRRAAALAVLRHFRNEATVASRRRTAALAWAIRLTGGWPVARHRLDVKGSAGSRNVETLVAERFGPGASIGISLGPPRANRKPILQVLDADLEPLAVGKVGITDLSRRLVQAETEALTVMGRLPLSGVRVPMLQHACAWNGNRVLFMTVLPLAEARSVVPGDLRDRAMVAVARSSGVQQQRPGESDHFRNLREAAMVLPHARIRARTLEALDVVMASDDLWSFGSWHGDWTDWNMALLGDEVLLWDWERYANGVPLGWDALHYALRRDFLTDSVDVRVAQRLLDHAPRLLEPFGVEARHAHDVASAYLVELAVRYTSDGQREAGGRTARVEEWLLPVLVRG